MFQPPGLLEVIDEKRVLARTLGDISPESYHDQDLKEETLHFPASYNGMIYCTSSRA